MRGCWVNFQCWGVLLIWIIVGQGPIVLAVGAGGGCLGIFSLIYHFSFLSPSLWERARYRLKYCLSQRAVKPKATNQPTNCTCSRCGWGLFGHFYSHLFFLSSFSLSLGDGPIQTEILSQRVVKSKTTNQPTPYQRFHYSDRKILSTRYLDNSLS